MPWANFDDKFPRHPKVRPLSDGAFRLHTSGICFASEWLTDGRIEADHVRELMPRYKPSYLAELVNRGIWTDHGEHYLIHDYLEWNRSREQITAERERKRKGGKKGAEARWHHL